MLYRLSYERIFSVLHILPNNNTTTAPKKQEGSAKKWPVHRPQRNRPLSFIKRLRASPVLWRQLPLYKWDANQYNQNRTHRPVPYAAGLFDRRLFYYEDLSSVRPSCFRSGSGSAGSDRLLCVRQRRAGRQTARPAQRPAGERRSGRFVGCLLYTSPSPRD